MTSTTPAHKQSGLVLFLAVTFTVSWVSWLIAIALGGPAMSPPTVIPYVLGAFGPVIGAIVVRVRRARRHDPVPAHTVRLRLSARLFWVLPLLIMGSAIVLASVVIVHLPGAPTDNLDAAPSLIQKSGGILPFLVSMIVVGPLSEEPGWRGTAYPRLRGSLGRLQAGLLLGVIWGIWHLPLFFVTGTVQAGFGLFSLFGLLYLLSVIPMALLTGYAYERVGTLGAIAVHFGINTTVALLAVDSPKTQALILGIQAIVAAALLAGQRSTGESALHSAPHPDQDVTDPTHQADHTRA